MILFVHYQKLKIRQVWETRFIVLGRIVANIRLSSRDISYLLRRRNENSSSPECLIGINSSQVSPIPKQERKNYLNWDS